MAEERAELPGESQVKTSAFVKIGLLSLLAACGPHVFPAPEPGCGGEGGQDTRGGAGGAPDGGAGGHAEGGSGGSPSALLCPPVPCEVDLAAYCYENFCNVGEPAKYLGACAEPTELDKGCGNVAFDAIVCPGQLEPYASIACCCGEGWEPAP